MTPDIPEPLRPPKLGPGGEILDVDENREHLQRIAEAPALTPHALLGRAQNLMLNEATQGLANHLAFHAMRMIVVGTKTNEAVEKIAGEPVDWSIFGEIWGAIVGFFTGTNPSKPQGSPNPGGQFPCEVKCYGAGVEIMVERCWTGVGDNYGPWHIIGACIGFNF